VALKAYRCAHDEGADLQNVNTPINYQDIVYIGAEEKKC